jgi:signal peptidase I
VRNPVDRLTKNLPHGWRVAIDWAVTIAGAILIVLAIKQWVVNPYRIPSSSMEPTLHCGSGGPGCEARFSDRVLACRFCFRIRKPKRFEIVVFNTPPKTEAVCHAGGTFVKRIIGLPGDHIREVSGGILYVNGKRLHDNFIQLSRRRADSMTGEWNVPKNSYFMMGDNRGESCDSRAWGSVPRKDLIGPVFATYWPPSRISLHVGLLALPLGLLWMVPLGLGRRARALARTLRP